MAESRREQLSAKLHEIMGSGNVYFQPPENIKLTYPCIQYKKKYKDNSFANDRIYISRQTYEILVISRDPEEPIAETISEAFLYCRPGPSYVADNLHHYPFTVYW